MKLGTFFSQLTLAVELNEVSCVEHAMEKLVIDGLAATDIDSHSAKIYGAEHLKKIHSNYGLDISSMYHLLDFDYKRAGFAEDVSEDIKIQLEAASAAGTSVIMPVPVISYVHETDGDRNNALKYTTEYIDKFVCEAKKYNIKIGIENYSSTRTTLAYISDIEYILDRVPDAFFILDSGNFWFSGGDAMEACKRFSSKTIHVHLKDLDDNGEGLCVNGKTSKSVAIGDGIIPVYDIVNHLESKGYDSYYTIEINHNSDMLSTISKSLFNLSNKDK